MRPAPWPYLRPLPHRCYATAAAVGAAERTLPAFGAEDARRLTRAFAPANSPAFAADSLRARVDRIRIFGDGDGAEADSRARKLLVWLWIRDSFRRTARPLSVGPGGLLRPATRPTFEFARTLDYHVALFDTLTVQVAQEGAFGRRDKLVTRFSVPLRSVAASLEAQPGSEEGTQLTLKATIEFPAGDTQSFLEAEDFLRPVGQLPRPRVPGGEIDLLLTLYHAGHDQPAPERPSSPVTATTPAEAVSVDFRSRLAAIDLPALASRVVAAVNPAPKQDPDADGDRPTYTRTHLTPFHIIRDRFFPVLAPFLFPDTRHRDAFLNSAKDVDSLLAAWFGITNIVTPRRWMSAWDALKLVEGDEARRPPDGRGKPADPRLFTDAARWIKHARAAYGRSAGQGLLASQAASEGARSGFRLAASTASLRKLLDFRRSPAQRTHFFPEDEQILASYVRDAAHRDAARERAGAERYLALADSDASILYWASRYESVSHPVFYAAHAREDGPGGGALVLSLRGTWSVEALVSDLAAHYTPAAGFLANLGRRISAEGWDGTTLDQGVAHHGFLAAASALVSEYASLLESLVLGYRPSRIVLTGHSYGAATATLLGAALAHGGWLDKWASFGLPGLRAEVFAFAPVPVASPQLASLLSSPGARDRLAVRNLAMHLDEVPRISYGALLDLRERVVFAESVLRGLPPGTDRTAELRARLADRRRGLEARGWSGHPKLQLLGETAVLREDGGQWGAEVMGPCEMLGVRARGAREWIGWHALERMEEAVGHLAGERGEAAACA
ncbi:hypothetical protein DFJ74DRAFT_682942 [Hyaloraphidium curvatum]|nr:hypothetical protein DFJ74DRAFT_682942 [Hyaloraphidium curvatum]